MYRTLTYDSLTQVKSGDIVLAFDLKLREGRLKPAGLCISGIISSGYLPMCSKNLNERLN